MLQMNCIDCIQRLQFEEGLYDTEIPEDEEEEYFIDQGINIYF